MIPLGSNNFWFGVVEDIYDPEEQGRVRVRIFGIHTENKELLPTSGLPWASLGLPANNPAISGKGTSPNGLMHGSVVAGIFLDGLAYQQPLVLFSMPGRKKRNKNPQFGFNDPLDEYPLLSTDSDINSKVGQSHVNQEDTAKNRTENESPPSKIEDPDPFDKPDTEKEKQYPNTPWMDVASSQLGINERDNATRVKEYHKKGGGVAFGEHTPWCASFVNWCLAEAKIKGTRSAWARSFSTYGVDVKSTIPFGSIVVMSGSRSPNSGHVAFVTQDKGGSLEVIGGNQSSTTSRGTRTWDNGGAVSKQTFNKSLIVAVRFPQVGDEKKAKVDTKYPVDKIDAATGKI